MVSLFDKNQHRHGDHDHERTHRPRRPVLGTLAAYQAASAAFMAADKRGVSERTLRKYAKKMFAAEDAYKAIAGA